MFGLLAGIGSIKDLTGSNNDSAADKLSHLWTVMLLGMLAAFVTTGLFVGDAINCWCPAEFSGAWVSYTTSVCWVKNTYFIPMESVIPTDIAARGEAELQYYQWVPVIFIFMALLFKIPNLVWNAFNDGAGINLDKIVDLAGSTQLVSSEERESTINHIAVYMDRWLESNRDYSKSFAVRMRHKVTKYAVFLCARREGNYLVGFYLFSKLLYMANIVGQFFLLNAFLAIDFNWYGSEVIDHLLLHGDLKESPRFPRVTLCDFQIRQLQNLLNYTVQCVLPINLFNEKIFAFLWFWLVLLGAITAADIIAWVYKIAVRRNRGKFVRSRLRQLDFLKKGQNVQLAAKFADEFLRDDGIFVLRIIGKNSTDVVVTDVIAKLWVLFKNKNKKSGDDDNAGEADVLV